MKRILLASILIALLSVGAQPVAAQEPGQAKEYEQEWQGMGIGAVIGAIAGGPPGLVVGLAGGALVGRHQGLESDLEQAHQQVDALVNQQSKIKGDLEQSRLEIASLRQKLEQSESTQVAQTEALTTTKQQHEIRLDAIVQGFLLNIQFRTESADLESHFQQQLDRALTTLLAFPELVVHIDAYADRRGTTAFNHALAQRRANVVVRRLRAAGISDSRIKELALGESRAEYLTQDTEGMSFDRRVLLYFRRR